VTVYADVKWFEPVKRDFKDIYSAGLAVKPFFK